MKNVLVTAYSLEIGGIEKSLINLLKFLKDKYNVTIVLEKKQGLFLDEIPENIKVIEYKISNNKNVFIRKLQNYIKYKKFIKKYKNKFDISISYATYSAPGSKLVRGVCKNNILWIHGNYSMVYNKDKEKIIKFYNTIKVEKFNKIVFVSKESYEDQLKLFPNIFAGKAFVCNNLIDYKKILKDSEEQIEDKDYLEKNKEKIFINVARHDEEAKKITRIILSTKDLIDEGYKFKVFLIGNGPDTHIYKKMVDKYGLENNIIFLGFKKNPYPYFKIADANILSSKYEGYPVVYLESMILNIPVITTKVPGCNDIENKFGIVVENSKNGIYLGMKEFLEKGFKNNKFIPEEYNENIKRKLINILENYSNGDKK